MIWYRRVVMGFLVAGLSAGLSASRAEDPAAPAAAPPASSEAPKKKESFFGDKFAMYIETRGGPASIDSLSNPTSNGSNMSSQNEVSFNSSKSGQFTIGWTLPRDRGQYLLVWNGVADGSYDLKATGYQRSFISEPTLSSATPADQLPWWSLTVSNGQLQSSKTPPVWNSVTDDANDNDFPDTNEFRYPNTTSTPGATVPSDLGNNLQTWDLIYRREFGGLKIRAAWTAGVRYLHYEGAVPCPSWLVGTTGLSGFGYSDGVQNKMILMQQSTSGWGPLGSGEVDFNFFRQRLTLYMKFGAAFMLSEKLDADSGTFTFLALQRNSSGQYVDVPGPGHLQQSVSKTAWNTEFEAGLRVKLLTGFHLTLDWNTTGYLDTVLLPEDLSLPGNAAQVQLGTVATYVSRDIVVSSISLGLSYQF